MEGTEEHNPDLSTRVEEFSEPPDSAPPSGPPLDTLPDDPAATAGAAAATAAVVTGAAAASGAARTGAAASSSAAGASGSATGSRAAQAAAAKSAESVGELGVEDSAAHAAPDVLVAVAEGGEAGAVPRSAASYVDAIDGWSLLAGLLVTSTVVLIACLVDALDSSTHSYSLGYLYWALAGSITSLVIAVLLMVLKHFAEQASIALGPGAALFLLILWLAVSMSATFAAPFPDLGNGWLGCWSSLVVSGALTFRAFKDKAQAVSDAVSTGSSASKSAGALGLASIVLLVSASVSYSGGIPASGHVCGGATSGGSYAIVVGAISVVCSLGIFVFTMRPLGDPKIIMGLSVFLTVWWSIGAFVITFVGPFQSTGCSMNGYVSTWASLFAALALFKACGLDTVKECFTAMKAGSEKPRVEQRIADELPTL